MTPSEMGKKSQERFKGWSKKKKSEYFRNIANKRYLTKGKKSIVKK